MKKAEIQEAKFWFENGDLAGVAVLGEAANPNVQVWFCYSRSDIFLGTAKNLIECSTLIIGY